MLNLNQMYNTLAKPVGHAKDTVVNFVFIKGSELMGEQRLAATLAASLLAGTIGAGVVIATQMRPYFNRAMDHTLNINTTPATQCIKASEQGNSLTPK